MARRGKPAVVRVCKPDSAAQAEAVRLLIEQVMSNPRLSSAVRNTDKKQGTGH